LNTIFRIEKPWICSYDPFTRTGSHSLSQNLSDQVFALPVEVIFQFCYDFSNGPNLKWKKPSKKANFWHPVRIEKGKKEYDLKSFRNLCLNYYFNSNVNSKRITELRQEIVDGMSQLYCALLGAFEKHDTLLNQTINRFTKIGLLCLISGALQAHFNSIDYFLSQFQKVMKFQAVYATNPHFLTFQELTTILNGSQIIFRAIKHVESIVIKGQSYKRERHLALRYYFEQFVLSSTNGPTEYFSIESNPFYGYYCLPKEIILLDLSIHPERKNFLSSFQSYQKACLIRGAISSIPDCIEISEVLNYFMKKDVDVTVEDNTVPLKKPIVIGDLSESKEIPTDKKSKPSPALKSSTTAFRFSKVPPAGREAITVFRSSNSRTLPTVKRTEVSSSKPLSLKNIGAESSAVFTESNNKKLNNFLLNIYFPIYFKVFRKHYLSRSLFEKIHEIQGKNLFYKLDQCPVFFSQLMEYLSLLISYAVIAFQDLQKNDKVNFQWNTSGAPCYYPQLPSVEKFLKLFQFNILNFELITRDPLNQDFHEKRMRKFLDEFAGSKKIQSFSWKERCAELSLDYSECLLFLPDFMKNKEIARRTAEDLKSTITEHLTVTEPSLK
jgi:hypothetical protein